MATTSDSLIVLRRLLTEIGASSRAQALVRQIAEAAQVSIPADDHAAQSTTSARLATPARPG